MKWKIVTDSSSDLKTNELATDGIDFSVVPLKIVVGETEFVDDDNINTEQMLNSMSEYKGASTSACPSVGEFVDAYNSADNVLAVVMTSALSGTYNSASQAKDIVLEQNPNKNIYVVDSKATAGTLELISQKAIELIKSGISFNQFVEKIEEYTKDMRLLFTLSNFDNLVKTGRMSKIASLVASTLGIRAIATKTDEGEIKVLEKTRGEANALKKLVEIMATQKEIKDLSVIISHCQNFDAANALKTLIQNTYENIDVKINQMKGLTSFYSQKMGLIVSF